MELTEPDLLIIPFNLLNSTEDPSKKSIRVHQFLSDPFSSKQLRRPSITKNPPLKRQLSNTGELNQSIQQASNEIGEKSDSSRNQLNHLVYSPRQNSKFSVTPSNHQKHDRHIKFHHHTSVPRKSGFSAAASPAERKLSFSEKVRKSLFRAQTVNTVEKGLKHQNSEASSNKDPSLSDLKPQLQVSGPKDGKNPSLKIIIGDGLQRDKTSEESDLLSPIQSPSSVRQGINDMVPKSALRRKVDKQSFLMDKEEVSPITLSNVIRRKSCHCTDCGGLSKFEKRHLNIIYPSKRAELNMQNQKMAKNKPKLSILQVVQAVEALASLQLEPLDEEASAEARMSSKIATIQIRKKSQDSPNRFTPLLKQMSFRRNTKPDPIKLDPSECSSPLLSGSPVAGDQKQISRDLIHFGDDTVNIDQGRLVTISPVKESEGRKTFDFKDTFGEESPITLKPDVYETQTQPVSRRSSTVMVTQQTPSGQLNPMRNKEEKKNAKSMKIKNIDKLRKADTPISARNDERLKGLRLPDLENMCTVKRSMSTRNRSREFTIKGIYGLSRNTSEERSPSKNPLMTCRTMKNGYQLGGFDSPMRAEPLMLPDVKERGHPLRHKNLSLQLKRLPKYPQLPFDSQKSGRLMKGQDSLDSNKAIRTERDTISPLSKSSKVFDFLKTREMSTESSEKPKKKLKGLKLGKVQIGQMIKIYRNGGKTHE